jgi:hypothetical protein
MEGGIDAGVVSVTGVGGVGRWDNAAARAAGAALGGKATPAGMMLAKADARAGGKPDGCCPCGGVNGIGCPACVGWECGRTDVAGWGGTGSGAGGASAASLPRLRTQIPTRQSLLRVVGRRRSSRISMYSGSGWELSNGMT